VIKLRIPIRNSGQIDTDVDTKAPCVSTLLIPLKKYHLLISQLRFRELTLPCYLTFLLQNYSNHMIGNNSPTAVRKSARLQYQQKGQMLISRSLRVETIDWILLGQLARALGYSRCFLFILMLELDYRKNQSGLEAKNNQYPFSRCSYHEVLLSGSKTSKRIFKTHLIFKWNLQEWLSRWRN